MNNFERHLRSLAEKKEVVYKPILRPVGQATLPRGLKWEYVAAPPDISFRRPELPTSVRWPHGLITTGRPLTKQEMETFDIEIVKDFP